MNTDRVGGSTCRSTDTEMMLRVRRGHNVTDTNLENSGEVFFCALEKVSSKYQT